MGNSQMGMKGEAEFRILGVKGFGGLGFRGFGV